MDNNEYKLTRSEKRDSLLYIKYHLNDGKTYICCLFMDWIRNHRGIDANIITAMYSFDELMDEISNNTHGFIDIDTWLSVNYQKPMHEVRSQAQEIRHKIIDKLLKEF